MKQITTTVYSFDELSDKAKQKAREWFLNGFEFNSESDIEDTTIIGKFLGFEIEKVYFSGFSSQGDGACFEGSWNGILDLDGLKAYAPKDIELHKIGEALAREVAAFPYASFTVKHRGHYYHDKSTEFDFALSEDLEKSTLQVREKVESHRQQLIDLSRDFMRWIYRKLEEDYNWQTADAQVDESIKSNDSTFTVDGEWFG